MKKILIIISFSFFLFQCNKITNTNEFSRNEIIFWKYNESLTFEMLNNELEEVQKYFESFIIIPLNIFDYYFWDEQILCMKYSIYENNYENEFYKLYSESDYGSIFFSIIINNKIVFNGLNRIMFMSAQMKPYDYMEIPIMTCCSSMNKDNMYFRLGYLPGYDEWSIHDHFPDEIPNYTEDGLKHPEIGEIYISSLHGNLDLLFKQEIYEYFLSVDKIICGRFNIKKLLNNNILEEINSTK
jgi:hypothetical protein